MANKASQYYNGTNWQQFELTTSDITLYNGVVATVFFTTKDFSDNMYIMTKTNASLNNTKLRIVKINKYGVVSKFDSLENYYGNTGNLGFSDKIKIGKDNSMFFIQYTGSGSSGKLYYIPNAQNIQNGFEVVDTLISSSTSWSLNFDIYKDIYIWITSGTSVKIYNYETKSLLDSESITASLAIACSSENILYSISANTLTKLSYGLGAITKEDYAATGAFTNAKSMKIDKDDNLLILCTPSSGNSSVLKYKTNGTQIGNTLTLNGLWAGIDCDTEGNVFWWKESSTVKSLYSSSTTGVSAGVEIRSTGINTYGNNITGNEPSIYE